MNRNNNRRGGGVDRSRLPLEQGTICSLKDAFGFISCADRDDEIFFHFSEVQGMSPEDLKVNDEVEFRVGNSSRGGDDKLAAYEVVRLEPGTIVLEHEEPGLYRGLVERATRFDRGNFMEGTIRILVEKQDPNTGETIDAPEGPLVRFTNNDYVPTSEDDRKSPKRLSRGDFVEFGMVTLRRNKEKYARNIKMLLSERERVRQEEERRMLEDATLEHGVVTALKGDYGFLRSNKRREEVYFHYSSVVLEGGDEGDGQDMVLKEGQDMMFLVVTEGSGEKGDKRQKRRVSARNVTFQPRGSVRFHDALACGVTGIVVQAPQPIDSGHSLETRGKVLLHEPIHDTDGDGNDRVITEVYLSTRDSPGGTYDFRGGTSAATWVQLGDTLLFDVVKDFVDGACHASPTKHLVPNPTPLVLEDEGNANEFHRRVRLIGMSLIGRAEGVVNAVKENYGFIHFAERPVDVHFKLFQLMPDELQQDVRRNMGLKDVDNKGRPLRLSVDTECHFDISVHGTIHSNAKHGRRGNDQHERENLKAQRILLLPPGTIVHSKVLGSKIRGIISKEDMKQPYAGMVDLETTVNQMSLKERHPFVARMISSYLESAQTTPMVYHDIQSAKEEDVILQMMELEAKGKLSWSHIPQAGETVYPGRLCIKKVAEGDQVTEEEQEAHGDDDKSCDDLSTDDRSTTSDDLSADKEKRRKSKSGKKRRAHKVVKAVRYDKSSLAKALKEDRPPAVGDVVEFDVVQHRRTGQVTIENMRMVERNSTLPEAPQSSADSGLGVVKDVVTARNFGFISVLDENATKREMLFFSLSSVVTPAGADGGGPNGAQSKRRQPQIRKGDEVKFDLATEKNGKRVALNVKVVQKGTIPSKAEKNACRGIILLEPSHTTLSTNNTPLRNRGSGGSSDNLSRWDSASDDGKKGTKESSLEEDGFILLLDDPSNMFASTITPKSSASDNDTPTSDADAKSNEDSASADTSAKFRLRYKLGAVAIHGTGSDDASNPRRGDLVSFVKARSGKHGARDIRIVNRKAANFVRGRIENIILEKNDDPEIIIGTAKFIAATEKEETYDIDLSDVVSCHPSLLKEKDSVEGILHDGKLYGICRTTDLYLESKVGVGHKQRPKLNLTVKKDRGGKIMAQSMMAKGPDDTTGFAAGWTKRESKYSAAQDVHGSDGNDTKDEKKSSHETTSENEPQIA